MAVDVGTMTDQALLRFIANMLLNIQYDLRTHAGAIVTFAGTTRADNAGRNVIRLEYEAYEPMALSEMHRLAREAGVREATMEPPLAMPA